MSVFGSNLIATLPDELPLFFADGVLIDRRNGTPMEMDAYSLYLGLRAIEKCEMVDLSAERKTLVDAVIEQMKRCASFWKHGAWSKEKKETHLRFTAAAIRLLLDAYREGIFEDASLIVGALKRHVSFSEQLSCGLWFLHDTLEVRDDLPTGEEPRHAMWGASNKNNLVLNTHVDTLVTIMYVLRHLDMDEQDREALLSALESGVVCLKAALSKTGDRAWRVFERLDTQMRSWLFATYRRKRSIARALILRFYFPVRLWLRSYAWGFVFADGYIERDLRLLGTGFGYHYINLYDLIRFVIQANETGLVEDNSLLTLCEDLVDRGIEYAIATDFWTYILHSTSTSAEAIRLCEVIIARLGTRTDPNPPKCWIDAYCALRRALPPSPAIIGHDPLIVGDIEPGVSMQSDWDVVHLRNGRKLWVDLKLETGAMEPRAAESV